MNEFDGRRDSRKKRRLSERRRVFSRIGLQHSGGSTSGSTATTNSSNHQRRGFNNTTGSSTNDELLTSSSSTGSTIGGFLTREDSTTIGGGSSSGISYLRSDSPITSLDNTKISMKIQFHITVAPDNEPLILDTSMANTFVFPSTNSPATPTPTSPSSPPIITPDSDSSFHNRQKSVESIGDQIAAKLNRQNTSSTKRRQQLLVMHNQSALDTNQQQKQQNRASMRRHTGVAQPGVSLLDHQGFEDSNKEFIQSEDNITMRTPSISAASGANLSKRLDQQATTTTLSSSSLASQHLLETRQQGARSSTITGGMSDEATIKFLAKQHQTRPTSNSITATTTTTNLPSYRYNQAEQSLSPLLAQPSLSSLSPSLHSSRSRQSSHKEHIYFKRDGQRFGHEFTLKLAVNKTYRCLLKVRPLIPLQAISIQGSQVLFADCSQRNVIQQQQQQAPSTTATGGGRSSFSTNLTHRFSPSQSTNLFSSSSSSTSALNRSWQNIHNDNYSNKNIIKTTPQHQHNHRLNHAQTTNSINLRHNILNNNNNNHPMNLYQQQQNQMLRHFAASHCSSSSSSHLGGQLIYMFDWSANRFEVNKNKNRTQVNTVLKFKNGQILTLPLQVKFYQSECKQHLSWGSQLHFIDYDCNINNMGQINIDRIQYY